MMTWHVAELHYNTATGEAKLMKRVACDATLDVVGSWTVTRRALVVGGERAALLRIFRENFPDPRVEQLQKQVVRLQDEVGELDAAIEGLVDRIWPTG